MPVMRDDADFAFGLLWFLLLILLVIIPNLIAFLPALWRLLF